MAAAVAEIQSWEQDAMGNDEAAELLGQAVELGKLVEYQEGAVVSRTLLKRATGTVTLFAFDQGQGLSEHTAPFDALVYVLEGKAELTLSGESHHLTGGQMLIMPAGQPHALKASGRFKMLLVMLRSPRE